LHYWSCEVSAFLERSLQCDLGDSVCEFHYVFSGVFEQNPLKDSPPICIHKMTAGSVINVLHMKRYCTILTHSDLLTCCGSITRHGFSNVNELENGSEGINSLKPIVFVWNTHEKCREAKKSEVCWITDSGDIHLIVCQVMSKLFHRTV
jgi:hypothetical protein